MGGLNVKLNDLDRELIKLATDVAKNNCDRYSDISMHTGCVLKAKSQNQSSSTHSRKRMLLDTTHFHFQSKHQTETIENLNL